MGYSEGNPKTRRRWGLSSVMKKYILIMFILMVVIPSSVVGIFRALNFNIHFVPNEFRREAKVNPYLNVGLAIILLILFVLGLVLFWKKRKHHLINYRPIILCMITGVSTAFYCVLLPIVLLITSPKDEEDQSHSGISNLKGSYSDNTYSCVIPLVFTIVFAPMSMMANLSRYVKIFLLNIRDIGRMKLFNENGGNVFIGGSEGSINSDFEPNTYVKRLNKLVSKQITIICFFVPYALLMVLGISIIIYNKMQGEVCRNTIILYTPIMILSTITTFIIPYILVRLYKTLNFVNKLDIVINTIGIFAGSLLFISSLFVIVKEDAVIENNHVRPDQVRFFLFTKMKNNEFFFIVPSFISFICTNIIPLIEVFIADYKLKQKKLINKMEFTRLLMGSRFIESLKSVAVKSYCVELVIFWETHMKLMKRISDEYIKVQGSQNHIEQNLLEKNQDEVKIDTNLINTSHTQYSNNNNNNNNNDSIPSSLPSNYDLLLGLNKNIFGSNNDRILYTGCYSNTGINPNLINYAILENSKINEEKSHNINVYSVSPRSNVSMINRNRGFSLDDICQRDNNSNNNSRPASIVSSLSYPVHNGTYGRNNNYNNNNNNYRSINNNNNSIRDESTYSCHSYNSISQLPYNNYDTIGSDKAGLLHHSDLQDNKGMDSGTKTSYSRDSTIVTNLSFSSRQRKNPIYNKNTEIFYELFNIDPDHVVLPSKFWKEYNKLYHSFISEKSLATVNLDDTTVIKLDRAINFKNYTIDMFFPAIAETVNLIYQNLYPKLVIK